MPPVSSLWLWLALRFVLAGMLPLLLVAVILSWVLLPQVLADIETRHQALARAVSGQVEGHLRSAGRELSAVAEYPQQRGFQPASFWFEPATSTRHRSTTRFRRSRHPLRSGGHSGLRRIRTARETHLGAN